MHRPNPGQGRKKPPYNPKAGMVPDKSGKGGKPGKSKRRK